MNLFENIYKNTHEKYFFPNHWSMPLDERFSINVISWLGEEFAAFQGNVSSNEEEWLTIIKPMEIKKLNIICGTTLFAHYAFTVQRNKLNQTNILQLYDNLSNGIVEWPDFDWRQLTCDCFDKEV